MASKKATKLIKKALPGAKIVRAPRVDGARQVLSDAATPNATALLRKYGGAPALTRSRARSVADATAAAIEADLEVAVVQLKATTGNVPARLNRRTVVINTKTGKIESTSG
jgi:hypothetical protein